MSRFSLRQWSAKHHTCGANILYQSDNVWTMLCQPLNLTYGSRHIIEDLVPGGDLMSYMEQRLNDSISEIEGSFIIYQVLQALKYLHGKNIIHRDLKPETILLTKPVANARIILADFGQSIRMTETSRASPKRAITCCGTIDYVAPYISPLLIGG